MTASRVCDAFEARLKRLVGRSLRGVAYREIAYDLHQIAREVPQDLSVDAWTSSIGSALR